MEITVGVMIAICAGFFVLTIVTAITVLMLSLDTFNKDLNKKAELAERKIKDGLWELKQDFINFVNDNKKEYFDFVRSLR